MVICTLATLYDLAFFMSEGDYKANSPARRRPGTPESQVGVECRRFRSDYRAWLTQGNRRMIVRVDPHNEEGE